MKTKKNTVGSGGGTTIVGGPNNYTRKQKKQIAAKIKPPITETEILEEFARLRKVKKLSHNLARVGNNIVDNFTFPERLETVGNKGINFYDFYYNRTKYTKKAYIKNYLKWARGHKGAPKNEKLWAQMFNMFFGSITIFRPIQAMRVYSMFKPRAVLDPTMGWSGRLVGAAALDIPHYIGIDINTRLRAPYEDLVRVLQPQTKTRFTLLFQDALTVDYSKFDYDMVFTSTPYYNVEVYNGATKHDTEEEWNTKFYIPLFSATWKHLKRGGVYALNVPEKIYKNVCIPLWGAAHKKILLEKSSRNIGKYREFVYFFLKT
jgi:hypothetical protein